MYNVSKTSNLQAADTDAIQHTIGRVLHRVRINSRSPRKTPLLMTRNINGRLKFALDHLEKPADFRDKMLWSDEAKLELFDGDSSRHVWRRKIRTGYDVKTQYQPLSLWRQHDALGLFFI